MRRWKLWTPFLLLGLAAALCLLPSCNVGYLLSSGYYQAELLASRRPIDDVLKQDSLSAGEEQRLRLIPEIKNYGRKIGLKSTENYDTIALGWDRTIFNVSACDPVSFTPVTWWFPIVGRVPYLGFFTEKDARGREKSLLAEGYDVHVRTAGAYSTLGWFRDPILPNMLRWSEADLAETVFHELAHSTLWIPGSVMFNESFANFVGQSAVHQYLADTYGKDSEQLADLMRDERDERRFDALLHGLYENLDTVYRDPALSKDDKLARKAELYGSIEGRVRDSDIEQKDLYINAIRRSPWNNARLMQFQTYNSNEDWFAAILRRDDGNVRRFIDDIDGITRGQPDPFVALQKAAGRVVQNP
jgi:predicted aminopeptidase